MSLIHLARGATVLAESNPIPLRGEVVFEVATGKMKVGDGATAFASLAYLSLLSGSRFTIPLAFGDGVAALTALAAPQYFVIDSGSFSITNWTAVANASGSVVLKLETAPYATTPTFTEVMSGERVTLASAQANAVTLATPVVVTTKLLCRVSVVSVVTVASVSVGLGCVRA